MPQKSGEEGEMLVKVSELKEGDFVILHPKVWGSGEYVLSHVYISQGLTPQEEVVVGENYETLVYTPETARLFCKEHSLILFESGEEFLKALFSM